MVFSLGRDTYFRLWAFVGISTLKLQAQICAVHAQSMSKEERRAGRARNPTQTFSIDPGPKQHFYMLSIPKPLYMTSPYFSLNKRSLLILWALLSFLLIKLCHFAKVGALLTMHEAMSSLAALGLRVLKTAYINSFSSSWLGL